MSLRTPEQLQQMLEERKRIQQRKKEIEKKKYKKASEAIKQELKNKLQENQKNIVQEPLKYKYSLTIYQSPLIERETASTDLYQTREELMEDDTGEINWDIWDKLVDNIRKNL